MNGTLPTRWLLPPLAAAFLALSPAGAQDPAPAPSPSVVQSVEITGRTNVPEAPVRDAVKLKQGDPFTPAKLESDRKALLALGFFRTVAASQKTADGKTDVTFRLTEWPVVSFIRLSGNTVVDTRALQQVISTRVGQVLCAPQLQDDIRSIERLYRERGYVGRVSPKLLDEATRSGILRFEILEVRISDVQVEGGTPELRERCRRALVEDPPALYRPEAVAADQQRLLKVRGVKDAAAKVDATEPGKVRIRWILNPPAEAHDKPASEG